ncbi:MAG: DUF4157 domain-containing protein, partial [Candidatus Promineifilaceae bacterium]
MSSEHTFEDKGKVKPKPAQETAEPAKNDGSLTAADLDGKLDASTLTHMQQTVGNAAVQRFLAQRQGGGPAEIQQETASAINAKRGSGGSLDAGMAKKAGDAMGHDFSGVNVHTDNQADELSRGLGAKAFTTGNDIFFQSGAYNPGSSDGQQLLAHELTHVVQQGGSAPSGGKMTVNDPNDQYEEEADSIANQIMNKPDATLQRAAEEEEEMPPAQLKPDSSLQRAGEEEEEAIPPVQVKPDPSLQRIGAPEEEDTPAMRKPDSVLQRAVPEEEEAAPAQLKPDLTLQRQDMEEDVGLKADPALQRAAEEEEEMPPAQLKPDLTLQRQDMEE